MEAHRSGGCAVCHNLMDPVGFGLDGYDSSGAPRSYDMVDAAIQAKFPSLKIGTVLKECPVHTQGHLDIDNPRTAFTGPAGLARLVVGSPALNGCVAQQVYRFAMGRSALDDTDKQFVSAMAARAGTGDFKPTEMLKDLVASDGFRSRRVKPASASAN